MEIQEILLSLSERSNDFHTLFLKFPLKVGFVNLNIVDCLTSTIVSVVTVSQFIITANDSLIATIDGSVMILLLAGFYFTQSKFTIKKLELIT
jgi:hypothetical protein